MTEVYSKEVKDTHFLSVAPGLVDTSMQEYLCNEVDVKEFPLTDKFIQSKKDGTTRSSEEVSKQIINSMEKFRKVESGKFIDLREIEWKK